MSTPRGECGGSFDGGDGEVRKIGVSWPFRVVGFANSEDRAGGLGQEAGYEVQIGTGRGGGA
jgi:hypothetical protein